MGWHDVSFLVVDFETSSLDPRRARPLSVGWVPVRGGRVVLADADYRPIHPDGQVSTESMGLHGLLPEDLRDAPSAAAVGLELGRALDGHLLVAHGAMMEVGMLRQCGIRVGRGDVVDTIRLTRRLDRLDGNRIDEDVSLGAAAARAGVPVLRPHHAFGGALTTAGLFLALATRMERHGAATRGGLV